MTLFPPIGFRSFGRIESVCWLLGYLVFLAWCVLMLGPPGIPGRGLDFRIFYTAASLPVSDLYHLDLQKGFQADLWREYGSFVTSPFPRPPFYALLLKPLSLLSYAPALHVWLAVQVIALGVSALILRDLYGVGYGVFGIFIGFYPVSVSLRNGQDSALILAALLLGLEFLRGGRLWVAAALWAYAFQKFNMFYLLPVVLLFHCQIRLLKRLIVIGAALAAISISMIGLDGLRAYWSLLTNGSLDEMFWSAWNIRVIVWHMGWSYTPYLVLTASAAIGAVWLIRRLPFETAVWFSVGASLTLSWHSYCYDYTVALPFFYLGWREYHAHLAGAPLLGAFWFHFFDSGGISLTIACTLLLTWVELVWRTAPADRPGPEVTGSA